MSAIGDLPAFPADISALSADWLGLTKRELFAAMAMQGIAAQGLSTLTSYSEGNVSTSVSFSVSIIAEGCVNFADALIAELAKDK